MFLVLLQTEYFAPRVPFLSLSHLKKREKQKKEREEEKVVEVVLQMQRVLARTDRNQVFVLVGGGVF